MNKIWLANPEDHDFPAALDYLGLLMTDREAAALVSKLKKAKTITKKAKDILRTCELPHFRMVSFSEPSFLY